MQIFNISVTSLSSLFLLFMLLYVLITGWRNQIFRYFAFFLISALGIPVTILLAHTLPDSSYLALFNRICLTSTALLFSYTLILSLILPEDNNNKLPYIYSLLILTPAFVISYILGFTDLIISKVYFIDHSLINEYKPVYSVYLAILSLYFIAGIANLINSYFKSNIKTQKKTMLYIIAITFISVSITAVCLLVLPKYNNLKHLDILGLSLAISLFTGSFFYWVTSGNVTNILSFIHKTSFYIIMSMTIFLLIHGIIKIYELKLWFFRDTPSLIIAGLVVIIFILFTRYIQPIIDKIFKRKQFEFNRALGDLITEMGKIKDFRSIIQKTVNIICDSLLLKTTFCIMFNNENKMYDKYYCKGEDVEINPIDRNSHILRWFKENKELLHLDKIYKDKVKLNGAKESIIKFFQENNIKIILPIHHGKTVLALICLGEKESHTAYKANEVRKLQLFRLESNIHISNAHTYEKSKNIELINRTLTLSSNILSKAAPAQLPNILGIKFGAFLIPKYGEGVDYFDFLMPSNYNIGVITTEISGAGVNSAIYSIILRSAFHACIDEASSTFTVIQKLNQVLYKYNKEGGAFITAYYFFHDLRSKRIIYTNAGSPPLELYKIEKNDFDSLDTEGIPLGYESTASYGMGRTTLLRGDIGILYSKALVTTENSKGENFELTRLQGLVKKHRGLMPLEIAEKIKEEFVSFLETSSPESDITVILFKIM